MKYQLALALVLWGCASSPQRAPEAAKPTPRSWEVGSSKADRSAQTLDGQPTANLKLSTLKPGKSEQPKPKPRHDLPHRPRQRPPVQTVAAEVPPLRPVPSEPRYPVRSSQPRRPERIDVPTAAPGPPGPAQPPPPTSTPWDPPCFHCPAVGHQIRPGSGSARIKVGPLGEGLGLSILSQPPGDSLAAQQLPVLLNQARWETQFSGQTVEFQYQYNQVVATQEFVVFILDKRVVNGETYNPGSP